MLENVITKTIKDLLFDRFNTDTECRFGNTKENFCTHRSFATYPDKHMIFMFHVVTRTFKK